MSPPPPPPPPPPPLCFPFGSRKKRPQSPRRSYSDKSLTNSTRTPSHRSARSRSIPAHSVDLQRYNSYSPTATITSKAEKLTFDSDTESYNAPSLLSSSPAVPKKKGWGYGWGLGKQREKERERQVNSRRRSLSPTPLPRYNTDSHISTSSRPPLVPSKNGSSNRPPSAQPGLVRNQSTRSVTQPALTRNQSTRSAVRPALTPNKSAASAVRPELFATDSQSTLVGSALERKIADVEVVKERVETSGRLEELRALMAKDNLDYYVVPSEDAHGSEYVAPGDKRREWISGFTGSAGQAIISKTHAYLVTDSRYWLQAEDELDANWGLVRAPLVDGPNDWQGWLLERVGDNMRIGIDARMISWVKASQLTTLLKPRGSKLVFPTQNFIDLIWKTRPARSKEPISIHPVEFAGHAASDKIQIVRAWILEQPASKPSYSTAPATPAQEHVATLISSLPNIAWTLNLRGRDIAYNPVFVSYLFISIKEAVLFTDLAKMDVDVKEYLDSIGVVAKEYNDLWSFLRRTEWGVGKVLISEDTSYAISLMLTHFRYTIAPSIIDQKKAIKNPVEVEGMRNAYLRDGASYVKWLAWLEDKLGKGYEITEYEAAQRLTEFRRKNDLFQGLAYENISASGPNAALPHYSPTKAGARFIDRETPYLNDSGGQYLDGTIDTTRTVHFGRPSPEQSEAFTRVLQGHIAIDSCFFPEGTSGQQLDVLARKALWKEGLNYLHGTGHGFGSYLNVHEGPHGFSSSVPLVPGHVLTNEPGFYNDGKWGVRIESALLVRQVKTKHEYQGPIWLGFERLTVVPIQTKMVKESLLSREETQWLKEHNRRCREKLEPFIKDDKRAMKWMKREAERGIGTAGTGPGGISIDWD